MLFFFFKQVDIYLCNFYFQLILQSYHCKLYFFPVPINIKLLISYAFNDTVPKLFTVFHHTNTGVALANRRIGSYWRISVFIHTMN